MVSISKALKMRAELKNRLVRVLELEKENFEVKVPVRFNKATQALEEAPDEVTFRSFAEYESEINSIVDQLTDLRERIDATSHKTFVEFNGEQITLARLRILVENKRAELERLKALKSGKHRGFMDREERLKNDDMEKSVQQITDSELESIVQDRIRVKTDLESLLEKTNVETELLD